MEFSLIRVSDDIWHINFGTALDLTASYFPALRKKDSIGFVLSNQEIVSDPNRDLLCSIAKTISKGHPGLTFYIIGTTKEDPETNETFNHELAHYLYYSNMDYNSDVTREYNNLPKQQKTIMRKVLKRYGYSTNEYIDETQAYLSTGLILPDMIDLQPYQKSFRKIFNKYSIGIRKRIKK